MRERRKSRERSPFVGVGDCAVKACDDAKIYRARAIISSRRGKDIVCRVWGAMIALHYSKNETKNIYTYKLILKNLKIQTLPFVIYSCINESF